MADQTQKQRAHNGFLLFDTYHNFNINIYKIGWPSLSNGMSLRSLFRLCILGKTFILEL